ncbi:MAG: T9SS type A sorting domain-containing protein [Flavobacteriales bacterium]|nr:T9SS type A sorting domain-containing protein [Flavobacteriales bacterium]
MSIAQQPFDLDPDFATSIERHYVNSLCPLTDGKLYISGDIRFTGELSSRYFLRLNNDGSIDDGFPDVFAGGGKITPWSNGYYCGTGQQVSRLHLDASMDNSFDMNSAWQLVSVFQGGDYHVFPDGRILFTGGCPMNDPDHGFVGEYNLVWFTNTGYLDTTRIHRKGNGNMFEFEALHPASPQGQAGQFVCSIQGTEYEGSPVAPVFRINADGSLDPSFNAPLQPWGESRVFLPLENGQVLAGGNRQIIGQPDTICVIRFLEDGSLDPTFHLALFKDTLGYPSPWVSDIETLPDGRLMVVGNFDEVDGLPRRGIVMLHSDGTVDESVFNDAGCDPYNYTVGTSQYQSRVIGGITPAPDGSYYIYGSYNGYDDGTTSYPTQRFVSRLYGLNVGVQEHKMELLRVAPNPTYGPLAVTLPQNGKALRAEVLDAHGRLVRSDRISSSTQQLSMNLSELSEGAYVLRLHMQDGAARHARFVIVR